MEESKRWVGRLQGRGRVNKKKGEGKEKRPFGGELVVWLMAKDEGGWGRGCLEGSRAFVGELAESDARGLRRGFLVGWALVRAKVRIAE